MRRDDAILRWAYLVELLLVGLIYGGMLVGLGQERLVNVIQNHWQVFSTTAGALFAIGVGAIFYFAQMLEPDFGRYLHWRKADMQYLRAYQIQALLFFAAACTPIAAIVGNNAVVGHVAWIMCLFSCVNGITIVQNTVGLVRLRQKFRSKHDALVAEMKRESE